MLPAQRQCRTSACQGRGIISKRTIRADFKVHASVSQQPSSDKPEQQAVPSIVEDPEAKFRRYGKHFGGIHKLNLDWLEAVPRVRVRTKDSRQLDELLELAVLNERLAGRLEPWQARQKLEYLRKRRKNWERIFEYVTKQDAAATLAMIEEANRKVEEALSEEARERTAVGDLREQLQVLQRQVQEAQERLQLTQARVEQNLNRVNELKAEAVGLERMRNGRMGGDRKKELQVAAPVAVTAAASAARPAVSATAVAESVPAAIVTVEPPTRSYTPNGSSDGTSVVAPPGRRSKVAIRRGRGLESSLDFEPGLRNFWYPAEFSAKLGQDTLVPFELFGEPWVLFRDEKGQPACIKDECAHRACPLSLGKVVEGQVVCAYHGWEFNGDGHCTKMPSTPHCRNVGVSALPCAEKDGFIWVWPGDGLPAQTLPDFARPPEGFQVHAEIMVDVPVEHGLLMENLLDLAHAPFTHTTTFARGWPVPDFVKFHTNKLLSGYWDPYPIDMAFQPPCMVLSTIGLAQPGKIMRGVTASQCKNHLHQLHVCMPSKKGHTRLLYRMSLDFLPWMRYVPFIDKVWKNVAGQVLGEDLVLVLGQQDRLLRGGNTWSNPAPYDKLAVRYRRWRNSVSPDGAGLDGPAPLNPVAMSAGEMFSIDEDEQDPRMQ
ncbi:chlorophyll a oxygenase [Volvox carteri f. nagariensis]|uniref:Chlorophyll a oxygenase n=1 Tax=Volvox carteri f. nagariensis TaxID=3068 RepID=D8U5H3_VOLCA|nr:chlorophyll a oxygenase [Volvox carteri f. nagariensis]EFJ44919.1 chlorophyll a oxygenase [Volvox carteri f. nagariensis]|eukprot:XP_002953890.1 chlorophyll a oxygenase [Volvox carteri f. nagariensis]